MTSKRIDAAQWRVDGVVAVKLGDGRVVGFPAPEGLDLAQLGLSLVEYRPWSRRLIFQREDGHRYDFELGSPRNWSPVRGRAIVYLDQNQWSTLSKSVFAPHRVQRTEERASALELLQLVAAKRVILPLSAGHMSETGAWSNNTGRAELADTMLSASAGWQLRDPLEVRRNEFRSAMRASAGLPPEVVPGVFTLAPNAALDPTFRADAAEEPIDDVPAAWQWVYQALLSTVVTVACLVDRGPVPRGASDGWVGRVQGFSAWLASETRRTKQQRRRAAYAFALSDAGAEIARAAVAADVTPAQMSNWIEQTWEGLSLGTPGATMFREVMVDNLVAGSPWEANDLTDLVYLCTAAAYANHVVGERRTTALLRQATRRLKSPVQLHTTLASLVVGLKAEPSSPAITDS